MSLSTIELFAGAGGLALGVEMAVYLLGFSSYEGFSHPS